jgi:hypothetical protein
MYSTGGDALRAEKANFRGIIEGRYKKARAFVDAKKGHPLLQPMPFNSGYFMSFRTVIDAETLRQKLLHGYGVGTIAIASNTLRVAFSGLDDECIDEVYATIYRAAEELAGN